LLVAAYRKEKRLAHRLNSPASLALIFCSISLMQILETIQVVSLAINLPGPLAVARLRSLGANVRKIEPPGGDLLENVRPDWYRKLHEGVEVERLDLKTTSARATLSSYLASADLLITSSRPTALEHLGLGWQGLHRDYPRLSQVAIVGNPPPDADLPGHDLLYQAEHGLVVPPMMPRTCVADLGGALDAVIAALELVIGRSAGQPGRLILVSLSQSASWFAEPIRQKLTTPDGQLGGAFPAYRLYRTQDGWIALGALERHFQKALAEELGVSTLDVKAMQEAFLARSSDEWVARARQRDLPLVKVVDSST
jgi:alpha-methylacyl-CoA racemase